MYDTVTGSVVKPKIVLETWTVEMQSSGSYAALRGKQNCGVCEPVFVRAGIRSKDNPNAPESMA